MDMEKRRAVRKALTANGSLKRASRELEVRIINVAIDGIALSARQRIDDGLEYILDFPLPVEGTTHRVGLQAKSIFCVYAGEGEYKAGLQFIEPSSRTKRLLERFLE